MTVSTTQSEAEIQRHILTYLATRQDVHCFRVNAGKFRTKHGTWISGVPAGTSDIVGWVTRFEGMLCEAVMRAERKRTKVDRILWRFEDVARFLAIEVKRPGGKPTAPQQAFLDKVNEAGGIGFVATSVQDVMDQLGEPG